MDNPPEKDDINTHGQHTLRPRSSSHAQRRPRHEHVGSPRRRHTKPHRPNSGPNNPVNWFLIIGVWMAAWVPTWIRHNHKHFFHGKRNRPNIVASDRPTANNTSHKTAYDSLQRLMFWCGKLTIYKARAGRRTQR